MDTHLALTLAIPYFCSWDASRTVFVDCATNCNLRDLSVGGWLAEIAATVIAAAARRTLITDAISLIQVVIGGIDLRKAETSIFFVIWVDTQTPFVIFDVGCPTWTSVPHNLSVRVLCTPGTPMDSTSAVLLTSIAIVC